MKIVLIGAGNVATALGRLFYKNGLQIIQVVGRSEAGTKKLAEELQCTYTLLIQEVSKEADIYIIAIPDDAVSKIADNLRLPDKIVVHTAGTLSIGAIKNISENTGVIWPLQSLRKEIVDLPEIPFVMDGSNEYVNMFLNRLLSEISEEVIMLKEEDRIKLHLSAVVVSNFTNHLYALTQEYCDQNNLPFEFLHPLISETASRLDKHKAKNVQTGPSVRGDKESVLSHIQMLEQYPAFQSLYKQFDESIRKMYDK